MSLSSQRKRGGSQSQQSLQGNPGTASPSRSEHKAPGWGAGSQIRCWEPLERTPQKGQNWSVNPDLPGLSLHSPSLEEHGRRLSGVDPCSGGPPTP